MQTTTDTHASVTCPFGHVLCWKAIAAGAVTAAVISLTLLALGSGIGFATLSPFDPDTASIAGFTAVTAIWMIVMQWLSAGLGGYLSGRLRKRSVGLHDDEMYFRDSAHGFLTWAVATLLTVALLTSAAASVVSSGAKAATAVAATGAAAAAQTGDNRDSLYSYNIDTLFRTQAPAMAMPYGQPLIGGARIDNDHAEATRIVVNGLAQETFPAEDRQYLVQLVSREAGVSPEEAAARVEATLNNLTAAKQEAMETAEKARRAASAFSIFTALSMLVGAFIAAVAAIIGGRHRDYYPVR